jgi:hypothetical protein
MLKTSKFCKAFLLGFFLAALTFMPAKQAHACGPCLDCAVWEQAVNQAIANHETWWQTTFWNNNFLTGMRRFTDQVVETLMIEARMIGGFMDAQNHLNSQRALQEMQADALKSYTPSESVCQFGTLTRSLAASQARARNTQLVLSERSQARQLGKKGHSAALGSQDDRLARIAQFQTRFCDPQDNNTGMQRLCGTGGPNAHHNLDIDFTRTVDTRPTLNINFTDATLTDDEQNVIALANNLYATEVFKRFGSADLQDPMGSRDNRTVYMDMRAVTAKRNAAEHSFNTIVGMKTAGTVASRQYIRQVLQNLGMPVGDIDRFMASVGATPGPAVEVNPSYSAQMEILTKKLYQDPAFYANLMDKPANVQRQYAAMQSFGLMQQRDIFETILRSEMLLSLIVELEVAKHQDDIQNRLNTAVR